MSALFVLKQARDFSRRSGVFLGRFWAPGSCRNLICCGSLNFGLWTGLALIFDCIYAEITVVFGNGAGPLMGCYGI